MDQQNITYKNIQDRNNDLRGATMLGGMGSVLTMAGVGGVILEPKNKNMAIFGLGGGAANLLMSAIAAKKANDIAPITHNDTPVLAMRPAIELATTVPGIMLSSKGIGDAISPITTGKIDAKRILTGAMLGGAGALTMAASNHFNRLSNEHMDDVTARRYGVEKEASYTGGSMTQYQFDQIKGLVKEAMYQQVKEAASLEGAVDASKAAVLSAIEGIKDTAAAGAAHVSNAAGGVGSVATKTYTGVRDAVHGRYEDLARAIGSKANDTYISATGKNSGRIANLLGMKDDLVLPSGDLAQGKRILKRALIAGTATGGTAGAGIVGYNLLNGRNN